MDAEPNAISFSEEFSFEAGSDSFYSATTPSFTEEGKPLMNNQYEQIRQIGQGSFGTVYLVLDQKDKENRQYALKEVICHDEQDLNKNMKEVWPLRNIKHENLVEIKNVFIQRKSSGNTEPIMTICFMMHFFKNGDLDGAIARRRKDLMFYDELELCNAMLQLTNGVAYLHSRHLIHRDLKPQNIFVGDDHKNLQIGDFGLVREMDSTFANTVAGTLKYIAPEIVLKRMYGYGCDIWSLGCIFYELAMLSLEKNFYMEIFAKKEGFHKDLKSEITDRYTEDLADIIIDMLHPDPDYRPSAKDANEKIQKHIHYLEKCPPLSSKELAAFDRQFVSGIVGFSTESEGYSAINVIGPPSVYPLNESSDKTWRPNCSKKSTSFIEVSFDNIMCMRRIAIYENYNPGTVVGIKLLNEANGEWETVYKGDPDGYMDRARLFSPQYPYKPDILSSVVRVEFDSCLNGHSGGQIDAIEALGNTIGRKKEKVGNNVLPMMTELHKEKGEIELKCSGRSFFVHAPILKARCKKLYEKRMEKIPYKRYIMEVLLEYLYLDTIRLEDLSTAPKLVKIGKELELDALLEVAENVCKISDHQSAFLYASVLAKNFSSTMKDDILSLLDDKETADITFHVSNNGEKKTFHGHSAILKRYNLFKSNEETVDSTSPDTFEKMLRVLYGDWDVEADLEFLHLLIKIGYKDCPFVNLPQVTEENIEGMIAICANFEKIIPLVCTFIQSWFHIHFEQEQEEREKFYTFLEKLASIEIPQDVKTKILESIPWLDFATKAKDMKFVGQWMNNVISCTSHYDGWHPHNMCGVSNVYPDYGDNRKAWAPKSSKGTIEMFELQFQEPIYLARIDIYETYNPGAVTNIAVFNSETNEMLPIYEGQPMQPTLPLESRIFSPNVSTIHQVLVDCIQVIMDTHQSVSWSEVDAIRVFGWTDAEKKEPVESVVEIPKGIVQGEPEIDILMNVPQVIQEKYKTSQVVGLWADSIMSCSSNYSTNPPENILGENRVYPRYGDFVLAWAPEASKGTIEEIIIRFLSPIVVAQIEVFETYNPGSLVMLEMQHSTNHRSYHWHKFYEGKPELPLDESRIHRPKIHVVDEPFDTLRITMDTEMSHSWYELDAIRIWGWEYKMDDHLAKFEQGVYADSPLVQEVASVTVEVQTVEATVVMKDFGTQVEMIEDSSYRNSCCFQ